MQFIKARNMHIKKKKVSLQIDFCMINRQKILIILYTIYLYINLAGLGRLEYRLA